MTTIAPGLFAVGIGSAGAAWGACLAAWFGRAGLTRVLSLFVWGAVFGAALVVLGASSPTETVVFEAVSPVGWAIPGTAGRVTFGTNLRLGSSSAMLLGVAALTGLLATATWRVFPGSLAFSAIIGAALFWVAALDNLAMVNLALMVATGAATLLIAVPGREIPQDLPFRSHGGRPLGDAPIPVATRGGPMARRLMAVLWFAHLSRLVLFAVGLAGTGLATRSGLANAEVVAGYVHRSPAWSGLAAMLGMMTLIPMWCLFPVTSLLEDFERTGRRTTGFVYGLAMMTGAWQIWFDLVPLLLRSPEAIDMACRIALATVLIAGWIAAAMPCRAAMMPYLASAWTGTLLIGWLNHDAAGETVSLSSFSPLFTLSTAGAGLVLCMMLWSRDESKDRTCIETALRYLVILPAILLPPPVGFETAPPMRNLLAIITHGILCLATIRWAACQTGGVVPEMPEGETASARAISQPGSTGNDWIRPPDRERFEVTGNEFQQQPWRWPVAAVVFALWISVVIAAFRDHVYGMDSGGIDIESFAWLVAGLIGAGLGLVTSRLPNPSFRTLAAPGERRFYVEQFWFFGLNIPLRTVSQIVRFSEWFVIDSAWTVVGWVFTGAGFGARLLHRGSIAFYALALIAGLLLWWWLLFRPV